MPKAAKRFASHKNEPIAYKRAYDLRKSGSVVEKTLWRALREQTKGVDIRFRYQHPVHPYITDFICLAARLIVEIDGTSHDATGLADHKRTVFLENEGFEVLRFSNADVVRDVKAVATIMIEHAHKRQAERWAHPTPRSQSERDPPARGG